MRCVCRVVNAPPPFGYNGVIYEKGQHKGQATPAPVPVVHREDTEYGERVSILFIHSIMKLPSSPPYSLSRECSSPDQLHKCHVHAVRYD